LKRALKAFIPIPALQIDLKANKDVLRENAFRALLFAICGKDTAHNGWPG
jgi:hypothetical protein